MQLKTKLLVYITVPIALAVCISSYMTYRTHSAAMRHIIEKDIKATSFFVAENINLTISDIKNSFRVAAKSEITFPSKFTRLKTMWQCGLSVP